MASRTKSSRTTLWRRFTPLFKYFVSPSDINEIFPVRLDPNHWVLGIDGKWLHRFGVIMIYRNATSGVNLWWSWQKSESYLNLTDDFYRVWLLTNHHLPNGIVSDWKGSLVALSAAFFPKAVHQRCLAHLVREAKKLLPSGSPFFFTLRLREIAQSIIDIFSPSDYYDWSIKLECWEKDYGSLLKVKTRGVVAQKKWWYTHGNLRRAIRLLTKDQDSLFKYLYCSFLPKTNNSLEGVNSQLKRKLGNHRGMKSNQQISFCFWYLAFSRVKTKKDLRILWDSLKKKIFAV